MAVETSLADAFKKFWPMVGRRGRAWHLAPGRSDEEAICGASLKGPAGDIASKPCRTCRAIAKRIPHVELPPAPSHVRLAGPQPGPQTRFLASPADVVFFGGSVAGGKTFALLMETLRGLHVPGFRAIFLRRLESSLTKPGALWDESIRFYERLNEGRRSKKFWLGERQNPTKRHLFSTGAQVHFGHLKDEGTAKNFRGAQVGLICFDQLEEHREADYWELTSRGRNDAGYPLLVRASVNPAAPEDPGGWIHQFIDWYLDDDGYAREDRDGVVRWFVRNKKTNKLQWFASRDEASAWVVQNEPGISVTEAEDRPLSFTFIRSSVYDNKILLEGNSRYLAALNGLPLVLREQLLKGNWKITQEAGKVWCSDWWQRVRRDQLPDDLVYCRSWDAAYTPGDGDWTAGVLMGYSESAEAAGKPAYYVVDVIRVQVGWAERRKIYREAAEADGHNCTIWLWEDLGKIGEEVAEQMALDALAGYPVESGRPTGRKYTNWIPSLTQLEAGNMAVVEADWTDDFVRRLHALTGTRPVEVDDEADAIAGAMRVLTDGRGGNLWASPRR